MVDPEVLRRNARRAQVGAEQEQRRVSHGEVDADYIQRLEHFPGLSHEEIYACVQAMDPGRMQEQAQGWVRIANSLAGAICGLETEAQAALQEGLEGHIAAAADVAAREFVRTALDVVGVVHSTGHRIMAAAYGAEAVRRTVPPPPVPMQGNGSGAIAPYVAMMIGAAPSDAHGFEAEREEQYRVALAALEANYVPTYPPAGSGVPAFAAIRRPGDGGELAGGVDSLRQGDRSADQVGAGSRWMSGGSGGSGGSGISGSGDSDIGGSGGAATEPAGSAEALPNSAAVEANPNGADNSPYAEHGISGSDADPATKPADVDSGDRPYSPLNPILSGSPAPVGTPGGIPHSITPAPSPLSGGPGRSFPAPPNNTIPTTPALIDSPNRSGASTPSAMHGMYPSAGRGTPDSDAAHKTPDWLIRNREHELLGTPPPATAPVIGAEIPATRTDLTPETLPE